MINIKVLLPSNILMVQPTPFFSKENIQKNYFLAVVDCSTANEVLGALLLSLRLLLPKKKITFWAP